MNKQQYRAEPAGLEPSIGIGKSGIIGNNAKKSINPLGAMNFIEMNEKMKDPAPGRRKPSSSSSHT
ncbi:MAG: hypothetical protein IBX39_06215 [Candidatus Methanoperedenaceae archaeon]|nr:hypothetical protein [Candidatus Methanoperedenaceae archaeon]